MPGTVIHAVLAQLSIQPRPVEGICPVPSAMDMGSRLCYGFRIQFCLLLHWLYVTLLEHPGLQPATSHAVSIIVFSLPKGYQLSSNQFDWKMLGSVIQAGGKECRKSELEPGWRWLQIGLFLLFFPI